MIALIGFTGVGKSTVGRILAATYGLVCYDVDSQIEQQTGRYVRDIFQEDGERAFRILEQDCIATLVQHAPQHSVIVTGGGAVLADSTRALLLDSCFTVHLDVPLAAVKGRLAKDMNRPLLQVGDRDQALQSLYEARSSLYEFAHARVRESESRVAAQSVMAKWLCLQRA